jgi:hypothetical protein
MLFHYYYERIFARQERQDIRSEILPQVLVNAVVLSSKSEGEIVKQLNGKVKVLYSAGDCVNPPRIVDAVEEGALVALESTGSESNASSSETTHSLSALPIT